MNIENIVETKMHISNKQYIELGKWLVGELVFKHVAKTDDEDVLNSSTVFVDCELCSDEHPDFVYSCLAKMAVVLDDNHFECE